MIPGWRHAIDLSLRKGLWLLPWLPGFLRKVKAIVHWLRDDRELVCEHYRSVGKAGLAAMIERKCLPNFANWRWATLDLCLIGIAEFIDSLTEAFDAASFKKTRNRVGMQAVAEALSSETWHQQFNFAQWYTSTMTSLLTWCGGCRCHGLEDEKNDRLACMYKGRLLPEAFPHATAVLTAAMHEVSSWQTSRLGGNTELLRQAQACMRGTTALVLEKLTYLDEIPYLLARVNEPGIAARCLAQFAEGVDSGATHDPVTLEFLAEGSTLRQQIERMAHEGAEMGPQLQREWETLRLCPIDDCPGEGPHAGMRHISLKTRAASWPWHASSLRLQHNLQDIQNLLPVLEPRTSFELLYAHHKAVLRMKKANGTMDKHVRMPKKKTDELTYTMKQFANFELSEQPEDPEFDVGGGGSDGDDGAPAGEPEEELPVGDSDWARMLREFYTSAFKDCIGKLFSIIGDDGQHMVFQLLGFRQHSLSVVTFRSRRKYGCKMTILKLNVWQERKEGDKTCMIDVFELGEPESIDFAEWIRDQASRVRLFRWEEAASDVEGCISMVNPKPVKQQAGLSDKRISVLALVDALLADGHTFVDRQVIHKAGDPARLVDGRRLASKRHYLQCVVAAPDLWRRGETEFPSSRSQRWYLLLLHDQLRGVTKENVQKRLAALGELNELDALSRPVKLARRTSDESEVAGDDGARELASAIVHGAAPAAAAAGPDPAPEPDSSSSSSSEESASSCIAGEAGEVYEPPPTIGGATVGVEVHADTGQRGLRMKCSRHRNCRKFCSLHVDPFGFGSRHAEYFLGAWFQLVVVPDSKEAHQPPRPTRAQVQAYKDSLVGR